jgi:hypothetical protein
VLSDEVSVDFPPPQEVVIEENPSRPMLTNRNAVSFFINS